MSNLRDFTNFTNFGEVSICEQNGRLCSLPVDFINISSYEHPNIASYPDINISRELCYHSANVTYPHDDRKTVMMPVNEPLIKRVARTFFEDGFEEALNEAAGAENEGCNYVLSPLAKYILQIMGMARRIQLYIRPHVRDQGIFSIAKFSQTRDWARSLIRFIAWHPNCFKIAVAACDDSIRIYSEEMTIVPILKSHFQKCITSLAWRPFTAAELAVGCQNGALVWMLDPNSHITRPLSQAIHLKHGKHFPITSLQWNQDGSLLATASINDSDILIWDVDQNRNTPLTRIGASCSFLKWSPEGQRLCTSTTGRVFRVWGTDKWAPERWTVPCGAIQSAAWSPCGNYLLFVTTDESMLYNLRFVDVQVLNAALLPKQALPIADLSKIMVGQIEVGGRPQSIAWDPQGLRLAIIFKDSPVIVIFLTSIKRSILSIAPDCFLVGIGAEVPVHICFQEHYKHRSNSVLTIGWSSGRVQYFPFV